jgi:Na+/H+ antiporter NhaD/arsenite permease-like protein
LLQTWIALAIFLLTYSFFLANSVNKYLITWIGAVLLILVGILNVQEVFEHYIAWKTIVLMISMMIFVGLFNQTGVFSYIAIRMMKVTDAKPIRLFYTLAIITFVFASIIDHITTVLIIVPLTLTVTRHLKLNPIPYLITEMIAANLGGTTSLIGSIPNMMIGTANVQLSFLSFLQFLAPIVLIIGVVVMWMLKKKFQKELSNQPILPDDWYGTDEKTVLNRDISLIKHVVIFALTISGFLCHELLGVDISTVAICGAILLIISRRKEKTAEQVFQLIHWETVFLITGIFAVVGALQETSIIHTLAHKGLSITEGNFMMSSMIIIWGSAIITATLDSLWYVASMVPFIQEFTEGLGLLPDSIQSQWLWWSLALGTGLGANATLIGSASNWIVVGFALEEKNNISFVDYFKIAWPIAIVSLLMAQCYVWGIWLWHIYLS